MQEITFEDGTKVKDFFNSFDKAVDDAKELNAVKPIKLLKITMVDPKMKIPKKRSNR